MAFKFEGLEVWKLAIDYLGTVYAICEQLPRCEDYYLRSQMVRVGTSTVLAIAEGSTGQTDAEQSRFLGIGLRSVFETVACQHVVYRRRYLADLSTLRSAYRQAETLAAQDNGAPPGARPWPAVGARACRDVRIRRPGTVQ